MSQEDAGMCVPRAGPGPGCQSQQWDVDTSWSYTLPAWAKQRNCVPSQSWRRKCGVGVSAGVLPPRAPVRGPSCLSQPPPMAGHGPPWLTAAVLGLCFHPHLAIFSWCCSLCLSVF